MLGPFSKKPSNLGVSGGRLAPPPPTPNCVSSQADADDRAHYVEPFRLRGDPEEAWLRLTLVLSAQPRTRIVEATDRYLRAEFRTRFLRFVDDVEFLLTREAIHVRSGSRVGVSDFGVNRRRVERLRTDFEAREANGINVGPK